MNETTPKPETALAAYDPGRMTPLKVSQLKTHIALIGDLVKSVMVEGTHYGKVKGVDRPFLFQAGAEVLGLTFNTRPRYTVESKIEREDHIAFVVRCELVGKVDETLVFGSAIGACSSQEVKYCRTTRTCRSFSATPEERAEMIEGTLETKTKNGRSWEEWKIKASPYELYQTILAMAQKRAFVAAERNTGAASQFFNIDEDIVKEQGWGGGDAKTAAKASSKALSSKAAAPKANAPQSGPKYMSEKQQGLIKVEAQKCSLDATALNQWCLANLNTAYFQAVAGDQVDANRKAGRVLSGDSKYVFMLTSAQASKLIEALKAGQITRPDPAAE